MTEFYDERVIVLNRAQAIDSYNRGITKYRAGAKWEAISDFDTPRAEATRILGSTIWLALAGFHQLE